MEEFNKSGFFTNGAGVHSSKILPKIRKVEKGGGAKTQKGISDKIMPKKASGPFQFLIKEKSK